MSKETQEQIYLMVAYLSARQCGNDPLAEDIAKRAKEKGFNIIDVCIEECEKTL